MNIVAAKLIATWCAAAIAAPRVPIRIDTALNSPASAVIVIAIGTPRTMISFNAGRRSGATREKILSSR